MSTRAFLLVAVVAVASPACMRTVELEPVSGALADKTSLSVVFQRNDTMELAFASLGGKVQDMRAIGFSFSDGLSLSADGKQVSYPTAGPDPSDFHQVIGALDHSQGEDVVVLPHGPGPVLTSWSPDGKRLAYVSGTTAIAVVDAAAGATPTTIANLAVPMSPACAAPAWSPDGRMLAYASGTGIAVYTFADQSTHMAVTTGSASTCAPRWSPDSASIGYTADGGDGRGRIMIVGAPGGTPLSAAQLQGDAGTGRWRWCPDGNRLAYLDIDGADYTIRIADLDGGAPTTIDHADAGVELRTPEWSADGSALLYLVFDPALHREQVAVSGVDYPRRQVLELPQATTTFYAWLPK